MGFNMREYKIKRGHNPDFDSLLSKYFGIDGNIRNGVNFEVDGIGKIDMRQDKNILFVNIIPPNKVSGDFEIIKKWNNFLFEATGKTTKERKKEFGKGK
jgi:hypothetical protein